MIGFFHFILIVILATICLVDGGSFLLRASRSKLHILPDAYKIKIAITKPAACLAVKKDKTTSDLETIYSLKPTPRSFHLNQFPELLELPQLAELLRHRNFVSLRAGWLALPLKLQQQWIKMTFPQPTLSSTSPA